MKSKFSWEEINREDKARSEYRSRRAILPIVVSLLVLVSVLLLASILFPSISLLSIIMSTILAFIFKITYAS